MKKFISPQFAVNVSIVLLVLLLIMHILIILKILPSDFVWAGQIMDDATLFKLELIALATTALFLVVFIVKRFVLKEKKSQRFINIVLWIMFLWFLLNIVGNMQSATSIEKILFIPISAVLALMSLRLALEK